MEELKPCPFCGGRGYEDKQIRDGFLESEPMPDMWAHFICCSQCGSEGPWSIRQAHALWLWNQRTEEQRVMDILRQRAAFYADINDERMRMVARIIENIIEEVDFALEVERVTKEQP